jgi:uncharacterized protein (UPF0335 family)
MTNNKLESYATRIDRLEEERTAIGADIKEIYTEVKSAGFNPKALRKVLAERRKPDDAQYAADLDAYRAALGMPGATYRSVAEELGVSKSKLQRLVPREENGTPKGEAVASVLTADATVGGEDSRPPAPPANPVEQGDRQSPLRDGEASADITTASALPSPPSAGDTLTLSGRTAAIRSAQ